MNGNGTEARDTVSVVLVTENQADLLVDCLASVSWADEIIVVDAHSTDATAEICEGYAQCRRFERRDYVEANKQFGFEQARCDWVLRIDTDERVTPELAAEVVGILQSPPGDEVTGYEFWERPVMLGRELRHGFGRRHYRQMMWRRGRARHAGLHSHEHLDSSGMWLRGRHGYMHLNYRRVSDYLRKTDYWTERDVERAVLPERPPGALNMAVEAARAFYIYYLKWHGHRDGWVGFLDGSMRGVYQLVYYAKLRGRWEEEHHHAR